MDPDKMEVRDDVLDLQNRQLPSISRSILVQVVRKPDWLVALDSQKFFVPCSAHAHAKKNEKNICCLDCCTGICPHCVPAHRFHRMVQVRRYVYHDVVRLQDLDKLIDCSNVQSYTINSSKVVFLKKRPQNRQFKGSGNLCTSCDRCLQEPYVHCSLECKVDYLLGQQKDLSPYLRKCKTLQLSPDFHVPRDDEEVNETTHSTIVEGDELVGSSDSENLSLPSADNIARVKRSERYIVNCAAAASNIYDEASMAKNISRRKSTPFRSPLS
ncbi:protein RGF1 INDUCIBLE TRANSCRIPTION FACTOR 1 [Curcuma longa]|uniref:protein RGF1 INDUCIBLE TRANSCRIPTION FACTOR 1 n=1 Tax=Curcuma longa TaxID=136217 RepID=UPI003D9EDEFF